MICTNTFLRALLCLQFAYVITAANAVDLIDPAFQDVYALEFKRNYGMNEFANLPLSHSPMIFTDRSMVNLLIESSASMK